MKLLLGESFFFTSNELINWLKSFGCYQVISRIRKKGYFEIKIFNFIS